MRNIIGCSALALSLATGAACAGDPQEASNNSWISVTGTVASTTPDSFMLDYGDDSIRVEMDDWDWYPEGRALIEGDKVTVSGLIDDDVFEKRSLEARSVYSSSMNAYYYASAADEELTYYPYGSIYVAPADIRDMISVTGYVVDVEGRHLTLDTGIQRLVVDTSQMGYNPLDDEGIQKIDEGDRVRVNAVDDLDRFHDHEVVAVSIDHLAGDVSS